MIIFKTTAELANTTTDLGIPTKEAKAKSEKILLVTVETKINECLM